jgi:hypothetical protein
MDSELRLFSSIWMELCLMVTLIVSEIEFTVTHTVSIFRNRIYVLTASAKSGALFAVDSRATAVLRLNISWNLPFEVTYPIISGNI